RRLPCPVTGQGRTDRGSAVAGDGHPRAATGVAALQAALAALPVHAAGAGAADAAVLVAARRGGGLGFGPGDEAFENSVGEMKEGGSLHGTAFLSSCPTCGATAEP